MSIQSSCKFHINGIAHIAIICSNYKVSKQFYTEILGFEVITETFRPVVNSYKLDLLLPGHSQIELFSFPHPPMRISWPEACGLRHIAFEVTDILSVTQYLRDKEIKVEEIRTDMLTGKRYTFFFDPDDLPIELYEK